MSCERHCKECQREELAKASFEDYRRLKALPIETRKEAFFAWWPVRCPRTRELFWMQPCVRIFESYIYWNVFSWPCRSFRLAQIKPRRIA